MTKLAGKPVLRASAANLQAVDNWLQVRDYESVLHDLPSLAALVARDLSLAGRLLDSPDPALRQSGLRLAKTVLMYVHLYAGDPKLAAAICETFLLPYLKDAETDSTAFASKGSIYEIAYVVYAAAKDYRRMEKVLRLSLAEKPNDNGADALRLLLAQAIRKQKRHSDAIKELQKMKTRSFQDAAMDLKREYEQEQQQSEANR